MRRLVFVVVLGIAACLAGATDAAAQSPSCTISATSVAFGSYNVFSTSADDSTGTVTYRCNSRASNIRITLSRGSSNTFSTRTMRKGSESLGYNLYTNAARTTIWGDGSSGTSVYTLANPPDNSNVSVTIYGRIPAGRDVSAGSYSDTIAATINF